ncbi:MAG: NADH-quinone oxidoreductase subunit L, partial [Alphaproteobacteria bacterium]
MIYKIILLLPLFASIVAGLGRTYFSDIQVRLITTISVSLTALLSIFCFFNDYGQTATIYNLFTWIDVAGFKIDWAVRNDALVRVMLPVVTIVSSLVHIYSFGYMADDPSKPRFFAYLSLFTFMMLALVTANNFLQMFFGWEGVGLASYLLIGYYFHKESACKASIKAFVVNRVADFTFILGLALIFTYIGSFDFDTVFNSVDILKSETISLFGVEFIVLDVACTLLFIGAMGKSAQLFLHTWLPDAMEGPTPVSALIHAATMVTAGVFLTARCSYLFEFASPEILGFVTLIGMATALFAATVGMTQFDIKRVIAYSTCSQLGYMFFAAGVGAYQAAIFHLFTHAFFKAMLFLGAGSVIHAMHHEQDMRNMGDLRRKIPATFLLMVIGTIAITGIGIPFVFGFSGFYSKDMILEAAFASNNLFSNAAFYVGTFVALLTSFYSWRLIFMVFYGEAKGCLKTHAHAHEAPSIMMIPVAMLAIGAMFAGFVFYNAFVGHDMNDFWAASIFNNNPDLYQAAHHVPVWVKLLPLGASLTGFIAAWYFYLVKPNAPAQMAQDFSTLYKFLYKKWYFDEIYQAIFINNYKRFSKLSALIIDNKIIDGIMCGLPAAFVRASGHLSGKYHNGYLYYYALAMISGVV